MHSNENEIKGIDFSPLYDMVVVNLATVYFIRSIKSAITANSVLKVVPNR